MNFERSPVLSAMRRVLGFVWVLSIIGTVTLAAAILVIAIRQEPLPGDFLLGLGWWGPGITLSIPGSMFSSDLGRQALLMMLGFTLASAPVLLLILRELRGALGDTAARTPFTMENARRIRHIGFATLAGAVIVNIRDFTFASFLMKNVHIPGVDIGVRASLGLETIGLGALILLLGEIFRYGVLLQEEHDSTV